MLVKRERRGRTLRDILASLNCSKISVNRKRNKCCKNCSWGVNLAKKINSNNNNNNNNKSKV